MRIAMIGTGYVGLVSGACFSEFGVSVTCVDNDAGKIERLKQGEIPIYEPGLDQLVASNVAAGRLFFTPDLEGAVVSSSGAAAITLCACCWGFVYRCNGAERRSALRCWIRRS